MRFELKQVHLDLLQRGFYRYDDGCEFGSIGLDCKSPFGDNSVVLDMAEILNDMEYIKAYELEDEDDEDFLTEKEIFYTDLYCNELQYAMTIILQLQTFELGEYESDSYCFRWKKL